MGRIMLLPEYAIVMPCCLCPAEADRTHWLSRFSVGGFSLTSTGAIVDGAAAELGE